MGWFAEPMWGMRVHVGGDGVVGGPAEGRALEWASAYEAPCHTSEVASCLTLAEQLWGEPECHVGSGTLGAVAPQGLPMMGTGDASDTGVVTGCSYDGRPQCEREAGRAGDGGVALGELGAKGEGAVGRGVAGAVGLLSLIPI